jgi:hypothetical protein
MTEHSLAMLCRDSVGAVGRAQKHDRPPRAPRFENAIRWSGTYVLAVARSRGRKPGPLGKPGLRGRKLVRQSNALATNRGSSCGSQVGVWLDASELRALDQAVEQGRHLGAALGPRTVVILSAELTPRREHARYVPKFTPR